MKILIATNHLNGWSGTETWVQTVYDQLSKDHSVDIFSLFYSHPGSKSYSGVAEYLSEKGASFIDKTYTDDVYDLVLCNHYTTQDLIMKYFNYKKLYYISHGRGEIEVPLPAGTDKIIPISEEVYLALKKKGFKPSKVILNPIDLKRYEPLSELNYEPNRMLSLCQGSGALEKLSTTWLDVHQVPINRTSRVPLGKEVFNLVDICCGLGRGAYESLACGRCVIIYDIREYMGEAYDGVVTDKKMDLLLTKNCSGRVFNGIWSTTKFANELGMQYVPKADYYRSIAEKYFDSEKICNELIS